MSGAKVIEQIDSFDKDCLKHVNTAEKVVLPDQGVIQKEKTEKQLLDEITVKPNLKHTETLEKNALPTKEDIAAEKAQK